MNAGRMVFSQLIGFLPDRDFRRCVQNYNGDLRHREGGFSCWDQFLCMAFAQLTYREGLRDIEACLRSSPTKLYHMGVGGRVSKSTLADANERHDWKAFYGTSQNAVKTQIWIAITIYVLIAIIKKELGLWRSKFFRAR